MTDESAEDISVEKGGIEFENVWFKYKKKQKSMYFLMFLLK